MHKKLLIPGPTEVGPEVLNEQSKPMIGHRGKEFSTLYTGITEKLTKFFELPAEIKPTVTTASGTLWFDIVGRSVVKNKALVAVNGAFAQRFGEIIRNCGKQADWIEIEWGKAAKPEDLASKLDNGDYDTLVVCHNETSTGVRSPVCEIGKMVRKDYPEIMFVIDSVSSLAGDKLIPSLIGCDVLFSSSQKCFALPPGLGIALVHDRAIERAKTIPNKGGYTDMAEIFEFEKKHQTPYTPNVSLFYALNKRMDLLLAETYDRVYQRHQDMAAYTQAWAKKHFDMFPEEGYSSITVSCIKNTQNKNVTELNQKLAEKGLNISNGYGKLADKTFRIGHMGEWTLPQIKEVIAAIDEAWNL